MTRSHEMYNEIELSSEVMTASNHRLIQLLLGKCLQHMQTAKTQIANKDISNKCRTISKAMDILDYLRICLNFKNKEALEISSQLDAIYAYLENILQQANIKNETTYLDEAHSLLTTVKSGWDGMPVKEKAEIAR